jgi:hypothetical protein
MTKKLTLNLKDVYFQEIKSGVKKYEYRLLTPYWEKRLINKFYEEIILKSGYPKKDNMEKQIVRPWLGYEIQTINHPHFGVNAVKVFAILVN